VSVINHIIVGVIAMGDASDSSWGAALLDKLIASAAKRQSFDDMHVSEQAASLPPEMVLPFLATWADAGIAADDPASIEWLVRKAGWRSDQIKAVCFKVGIINFPKEAGQLQGGTVTGRTIFVAVGVGQRHAEGGESRYTLTYRPAPPFT
jgi:hypothetical protein